MKIEGVHIGEIVRNFVKADKKSKADFAKSIGMQRQNVNRLVFEKRSLDTDLLRRISEELNHNFFQYFKSDEDSNKKDYATHIKARLTLEVGEEIQEKEVSYLFKNVK